jgi:hypothetical protein
LKAKLLRKFSAVLKAFGQAAPRLGMDRETHEKILAQVHFSAGAHAEEIAGLLSAAGFENVVIDRAYGQIRRAQGRQMPLHQRIDRASQDRYAIQASKPANTSAGTAQSGRRAA